MLTRVKNADVQSHEHLLRRRGVFSQNHTTLRTRVMVILKGHCGSSTLLWRMMQDAAQSMMLRDHANNGRPFEVDQITRVSLAIPLPEDCLTGQRDIYDHNIDNTDQPLMPDFYTKGSKFHGRVLLELANRALKEGEQGAFALLVELATWQGEKLLPSPDFAAAVCRGEEPFPRLALAWVLTQLEKRGVVCNNEEQFLDGSPLAPAQDAADEPAADGAAADVPDVAGAGAGADAAEDTDAASVSYVEVFVELIALPGTTIPQRKKCYAAVKALLKEHGLVYNDLADAFSKKELSYSSTGSLGGLLNNGSGTLNQSHYEALGVLVGLEPPALLAYLKTKMGELATAGEDDATEGAAKPNGNGGKAPIVTTPAAARPGTGSDVAVAELQPEELAVLDFAWKGLNHLDQEARGAKLKALMEGLGIRRSSIRELVTLHLAGLPTEQRRKILKDLVVMLG